MPADAEIFPTELDPQSAALAQKAKMPTDIIKWFVDMDLCTCEEVALLAAKEELVDKNIIEPIGSANVASAKLPKGKVAIGKFWTYCRAVYEAEKAKPALSETTGEAPIPEADCLNIAQQWFSIHNFALPDAHLLIANQQGKLWRDFNMSPSQVRVSLAEELRTRSCIGRAVGHQFAIEAGKPVTAVEVIADSVDRSIELFIRIRGS